MSGPQPSGHRVASDKPFLVGLALLGGSYLLIIAAMVLADLVYLDYGDRPVLGPESVQQGRYTGGEATVAVEPGRDYFFRKGENEAGLKVGDRTQTGDGVIRADGGTVILLPRAQGEGKPGTGSLRPEARVSVVAVTNGVAPVTTDVAPGQLWGEFIRVSGADAPGWDGVREITHTTTNQLSFAVTEGASSAGSLSLSRPNPLVQALRSRDIRFSIKLSLVSCTLTTLLSLWVAVPIGYLMSRYEFRGKPVIDTLLDIPIVLPPLVVGLSLLILFRYMPDWLSDAVVYKWPAVVLAQFMVACAFAVRTMRVTFDQIPQRYEQVAAALSELDLSGVEVIPQTMPPFPWYFGGQRFMNLFIDSAEIASFCTRHGYRVCFDTSHSKLACNLHNWSFTEFVQTIGPHAAHLHLGDASGVDGEGLQILEGDIDWKMLSAALDDLAPSASFIPEIWQGHKNEGEGFWRGLELLENYF